jgi:SdpC family antimicrobial peptide
MKKKTFSRITMKWKLFSVVALAGVTIVLLSFRNTTTHSHSNYTGEQLFKGLIFMDGPVANLIPELRDRMEIKSLVALNKDQLDQEKKMENLIVKQIRANNPAYFDGFRKAMTSGDQQLINATLVGVQDVVMRALASYLGIKLDALTSAREQINRIVGRNPGEFQAAVAALQTKKVSSKEFNERMGSSLKLNSDKISSLVAKGALSDAALQDANKQLCGGCVAALSVLACNVGVVVNVAGYINVALVGNVAVALNAAIALNIYVTVAVEVNSNGSNIGGTTALQNESFVNSIAVNL